MGIDIKDNFIKVKFQELEHIMWMDSQLLKEDG